MRVATLVATPLNSLVTLRDGPIKSIADLKGKKIGFSVGGFEDALLKAMLEKHGLKLTDLQLVNINFALSPALLAGRVDAVIGAFRNFELNQLDIEGKPGRAFYVEDYGAVPDGRTDCTPAFYGAVAAARASQGPAELVFGHEGPYYFRPDRELPSVARLIR